MPSTYTSNNKIQKIATGEQSGTWGSTTNTNFDLFDTAIDGFVAVAVTGTTHTLNIPDGSAADGRNKVLSFTGALTAANTVSVTPNTVKKHYFVQNNTTGSQNIIIYQGSGSTVTIKPGYSSVVYLDGAGGSASAKEVLTSLKLTALLEATGAVFVGSTSGSTTLQSTAVASGTLTLPAATDTLVGKATTDTFTNKTLDTAGTGNVLRINGTQVSAVTGTGSVVLATSPTLVTPAIGTPTSGTLTSCTGLPISTGVSGLGSGVATFLATPSSANLAAAVTDETGTGSLVFATSPTLVTPLLGTPTSGTLTNATGLPISTGVSGLGTGVATFLATPSSANLASAVTDETGSGALVFATSPTLATPLLGTPTSGTLTNCTGLPVSTGVSGLATGVATFLATPSSANLAAALTDETGTGANVFATSPTLVTPLLGTPTSGTLTSCTGLPISTGVSGLGASVATFLATPSSANLAAALTDETGTGANVFATSPTIATPTITTSAVIPLVNGGTAVSSTLTLQSTSGAGTSDAIIFKAGSQSEKMRIDTLGRVLIGAVSPSNANSKFSVTTAATTSTQLEILQVGNALALLGNKASDTNFYITNDYDSTGLGVANRSITLTKTGEVGIGTTSPGAKLSVEAGNIGIDGNGSAQQFFGAAGNVAGTNTTGGVITVFGHAPNPQTNLVTPPFDGTNFVGAAGIITRGFSESSQYRGSLEFFTETASTPASRMIITHDGNVGIGLTNPAYKIELSTDSAGKPGVGGLWTVVSDERIKTDITPADLDRCYEIVKSVPLKHFGFAPGVYTDDQIQDKHSLGWIAQDVQKVFSKAVSVKPFTLKAAIPDGAEEYTEQDFTLETVEKTETSIQVIDGKPVQVSKVVTSENKVLLFDSVDVVDEAGAVVMDGNKPLTYQMPRMITKTRNKVRHDVIEDCLDLNGGQMIAALYGAVQALMLRVESLKAGN